MEPPFLFMEPVRTVIFIDGENFRNNLRHFAYKSSVVNKSYPEYRLEERHFFWKLFFQGIIAEFSKLTNWQHHLVRVYWYYSADISPWRENLGLAQKVINRYSAKISLTVNQVNDLAKKWYESERSYFQKLREEVFEEIQRNTGFLEFKYVGQYQVRPYMVYKLDTDSQGNVIYLGQQLGEKGVDVGIAVDMIAKMADYDTAILISGDADFLPAVKYLKDHLKHVYQFSLAKGVPPSIEYLSASLKSSVDCFAYYDELRLLTDFLNRKGIPPAIVRAIDERVAILKPPTLPI